MKDSQTAYSDMMSNLAKSSVAVPLHLQEAGQARAWWESSDSLLAKANISEVEPAPESDVLEKAQRVPAAECKDCGTLTPTSELTAGRCQGCHDKTLSPVKRAATKLARGAKEVARAIADGPQGDMSLATSLLNGTHVEKSHSAAHPGFKAEQEKIEEKEGVSKDEAGAILAAGARHASKGAKKKNPKLKKVEMHKALIELDQLADSILGRK